MNASHAWGIAKAAIDIFKDDPEAFRQIIGYDPAEGSWFRCRHCGAYWGTDSTDNEVVHKDDCKAFVLMNAIKEAIE